MLEFFLNIFSNAVKDLVKSRLIAALSALNVKDEKAYKTVLASLYPVIDVQLEDITDKTKTKADDVIVDALKEAMEESAVINGVLLQNLDND
jgi:hypothetical protein